MLDQLVSTEPKYHCTIDLLFDRFGISCMITDNFCFYLQNRLIQTSQTGGQRYSDISPFSIPWIECSLARPACLVLVEQLCPQPKVAGGEGISQMKSKQQNPCSNCMHWPVTSWGNACSTCMHNHVRFMHQPVMSQADACTYCMGSKVSSLSWIYLYSSYFVPSQCLAVAQQPILFILCP